MSNRYGYDDDPEPEPNALPQGALSANGHWIFGSLFAGLILVGFSFGVWAGASRTKPTEVVEAKKEPEKPAPAVKPVEPKPVEPKPKDTPPAVVEQKPKEPESMPKEKEPEPKAKEPEPKPKEKEPEPKKVEFTAVSFKQIEPLFRQYCNNCHGSVGKPKGGLDLRSVAAIMKGGEGGPSVKPGDPEKSILYISMKPPNATMPPDGKQGPNEKELLLIYNWIGSGAKPRRTVRRRR